MNNVKNVETLEEAYERAALALASFRLIQEEIPGEIKERHENRDLDRKILRQIETQLNDGHRKARRRRTKIRLFRTVLTALIIADLCATVAFSVSPSVRSGVYRFFSADMGTHTDLGFLPDLAADVPSGWDGEYYPTYFPDVGLEIVQILPNQIEWESPDGTFINFGIFDVTWQVSIDTEGYEHRLVYDRQWQEYDVYVNEEWVVAVWHDEDVFFIVSTCELPEKETIRIAESVCPIKKF